MASCSHLMRQEIAMKKGKKGMKCGCYVASPKSKTLKQAEKSILKVLNCSAGDKVKIAAINALTAGISNQVTIQNCSMSGV